MIIGYFPSFVIVTFNEKVINILDQETYIKNSFYDSISV